MNTRKILVVDDNKTVREIIDATLTGIGCEIKTAENGVIALELFKKEFFPVIIIDLLMPIMDGEELIEHLLGMEIKPVMIVATAHDDPEIIIDIMKKGIFDYIVKPFKGDRLIMVVERALKYAELNKAKIAIEKEKVVRMEQQLEWYKWIERMKSENFKDTPHTLINNLNTCFSQGAGFGSLVTLMTMIVQTAEREDNYYKIDERIFNLIVNNVDMVNKALKVFSDIDWLQNNKLEMKFYNLIEVYNIILEVNDEINTFKSIHNHSIIISDCKPNFEKSNVLINKEYFKIVVYEILINALKFSIEYSKIKILLNIEANNMEIFVINSPVKNKFGSLGITPEYENIIFEPFVRINAYILEEYKTLDFGLGLNLVEMIIHKHNGRISLFNIIDYSVIDKKSETNVACKIEIPLVV